MEIIKDVLPKTMSKTKVLPLYKAKVVPNSVVTSDTNSDTFTINEDYDRYYLDSDAAMKLAAVDYLNNNPISDGEFSALEVFKGNTMLLLTINASIDRNEAILIPDVKLNEDGEEITLLANYSEDTSAINMTVKERVRDIQVDYFSIIGGVFEENLNMGTKVCTSLQLENMLSEG